jgi:hypothetical protein
MRFLPRSEIVLVKEVRYEEFPARQAKHRVLPRTLGRRLPLQHVIPTLQAEECPVMAVQCGLDTPEGDVATVKTGEEKS